MEETLTYFGGEVKALDDSGKVGGYLVRFTDASRKDLVGDYFTNETYLGAHEGDGVDTLFHHGLPLKFKPDTPKDTIKRLDTLKDHLFSPIKTKRDDLGIWAETVLNMADEYEAMVFDKVKKNKLGWSSGAVSHMVKRADDGKLIRWPIGEASLTPQPAEPTNRALNLKALDDLKYISFGDGVVTEPEEKPLDVKGIFEEQLAENTPGVWQLQSAFEMAVRKLATVAASASITGVTVDVPAKVTEAVAEYSQRLTPLVINQINDFIESGSNENFYLKSALDELITNEETPAASKFADHLQVVLAAAQEVQTRAKSIQELRIKAGRVLSESNRTRLSKLLESLQLCAGDIDALLQDSEPKPKSADVSEICALLAEFEHTSMLIDAPLRS